MKKIFINPVLLLLFCGAVWGGSPTFFKMAYNYAVTPCYSYQLAFLRLFCGWIFLFILCSIKNIKIFKKQNIAPAIVLGVFNYAIPYIFIAKASTTIDTGIVAILNGFFPTLTILMSFIFLRQKITKKQFCGIIISVVGVCLIYLNTFYKNVNLSFSGIAFVIIANILYAASAVYIKARCSKIEPIVIVTIAILVSWVVLLPSFVITFDFNNLLVPKFVFSILTVGIFGTSIAYIAYFYLIKNYGANFASVHAFLVPFFGCIYGVLIFKEPITIPKTIGAIVILVGMKFLSNISIKKILSTAGFNIKKGIKS